MRATKKIGLLFVLCSILLSFSACTKKAEEARIYLKDSATWSYEKDGQYQKLEKWGRNNLFNIAGPESNYIWVKFQFEIPDQLKNKQVGVLIPYIHFAEKTWLNGVFLGGKGIMPEDGERFSARYKLHKYNFPEDSVIYDGVNTLLVQVYIEGFGEISGPSFIGDWDDIEKCSKKIPYSHTTLCLMVEGGQLGMFLLFFTLYLTRRKKRKDLHNLFFALLNLATNYYLASVYLEEMPWVITDIPYLIFTKVTLCLSLFFVVMLLSCFEIAYLYGKIPKKILKVFAGSLIVFVITISSAPTMQILMYMAIPLAIMILIQWGCGISVLIKALGNKRIKQKAIILIHCTLPFYVALIIDTILGVFFSYSSFPYIPVIGYQIMGISFVVLLIRDINKIINKNEYLNENLEREIQLQTVDLTFANEKLRQETERTNRDLDMAGIVQEKFMPAHDAEFESWELAVAYEPLEKVSGDLYDFYSFDGMFDGLAIFDASGHGISASLITMLSKSIIFKAFKKSYINKLPVSSALLEINEKFIKVKGGVDNYLTGILLKINDDNDRSKIDLASAGHPYPVLYSNKTNTIEELLPDVNNAQFGAIGIPDIEVSFPDIEFEMNSGDILVLFTDGVIESANEDHEQFGRKRLEQVIMENHDLPISELRNKIINNLNGFMGETLRDDDVTFVILKKKK